MVSDRAERRGGLRRSEPAATRFQPIVVLLALSLVAACGGPLDSAKPGRGGEVLEISDSFPLGSDEQSYGGVEHVRFSMHNFGELGFQQEVPGEARWRVRLPARPVLRFDLWVERPQEIMDSFITAIVEVADGEKTEQVFSRLFRTGEFWDGQSIRRRALDVNPFEVDLERFAGREVDLVLRSTLPEHSLPGPRLVWGNPRIKAWRKRDRPNIVLVCIDTLRSDRVGRKSSGTEASLTPNLDRLAEDSVVFERTYAQAPWTLPSVVSALSGLPPAAHRAGEQFASAKIRQKAKNESLAQLNNELQNVGRNTMLKGKHGVNRVYGLLDDRIALLPDRLGDVYDTYLVNAKNGWLQAGGIVSRFRAADDRVGNDALAVRRGNEWIDAHRRDLFFASFHLMYVHSWRAKSRRNLETPEIGQVNYDRSVVLEDQYIGDIVTNLEELGLYEDTLLVVWSDHGEHLWDAGWGDAVGHGTTLSNALLRVPLIIKYPQSRGAGSVVDEPVAIMDIYATVLREARMEEPPSGFVPEVVAARALPEGRGDERRPRRLIPAAFGVYDENFFSVQDDRHRLIWFFLEDRYELLDLQEDRYLAAGDPEAQGSREKLKGLLQEYLGQIAKEQRSDLASIEIDPEIEKNLRALGYLN